MTLIEIIPAHSREHKRTIAQMTRGAIPMNPITAALVEMACTAGAVLLIVAFVASFVGWWIA